jgi:hypothetical protein
MNALQKSQRILIGLAIGVLLALLIAPETGWLARNQLGAIIFMNTSGRLVGASGDRLTQTYASIAKRHPNDFQVQLAYTYMTADHGLPPSNYQLLGDPRVAAVRGLIPRFGDKPSLYANILRYCTTGELHPGDRPEDSLLMGQQPVAGPHEEKPSPQVFAAYDQDAATGERLDPENAYFPLMRAAGLFAQYKDDAAIAEVLRAGRGTKFDDYSTDEVEGKWKLNEDMVGGKLALPRLAIAAALLFPHYADMREVARIAVYKAILLEQSGNVDQGLAIRFALMHCGSLMRVQSTSVIGSLVGIAITRTAMIRPGGAPHIGPVPHEAVDDLQRKEVDTFYSYLVQVGRIREAAWVRAESAAGDQVKAVIRQGTAANIFVMAPVRAGVWWGVDMLVLSCACWLIILGITASLLSRTAQIQSGEPLRVPIRWGISTAFIVLSMGIVVAVILSNLDKATISVSLTLLFVYVLVLIRAFSISKKFGLTLLLIMPLAAIATVVIGELVPALWLFVVSCEAAALVVLLIWLVVRGGRLKIPPSDWLSKTVAARKEEFQSGLKAFGITFAAFVLLGGIAYWQIHWLVDISSILSALSNTTSGSVVAETGIVVEIAVIAVLFILPAGVMGIVSLVRKVPLSITLTQGYRNWAVPIASLLLIGYGGLVLATLSAEREGNYVLEQIAHHEGAYYAQMAGQKWVGRIAEPDPATGL